MLGEKIRELRKLKGLTLKEFGDILNLSESTVSMYENNKRNPDYLTIKKIADFFMVSTDYLLGYTGEDSSSFSDEDQILNNNRSNDDIKTSKAKEETIADEIVELLKLKGYLKEGEVLEGEKLEWLKELIDKALDLSRISKPKR